MEYDSTSMPAVYDAGRGYRPAVLAAWLDKIAQWVPVPAGSILDLGCGTGRYSEALAKRFSMALHHFCDVSRALDECRRTLTMKGIVCVRAATSDQIDNYAYVPFFPASRKILRRELESKRSIETRFAAAGFAPRTHELVASEVGEDWNAYAQKLAYKADSILIQLPDDAFDEGLSAVRKHASRAKSEPVTEPVDFFVFNPRG